MWRSSAFGVLMFTSVAASAAPSLPRPIGNPATWITTDDYPGDALRKVVGGHVSFDLQVSAEGKLTGCVVTESSGTQSLDDATCRLILSRGSFSPAEDENGHPVEGTFHGRINWMIPDNGPIPLQSPQSIAQKVTFDVDASGQFSSCIVNGEVPSWIGVIKQICDHLPSMNIRFSPESSGETRHVVITVHFDVSGSKP